MKTKQSRLAIGLLTLYFSKKDHCHFFFNSPSSWTNLVVKNYSVIIFSLCQSGENFIKGSVPATREHAADKCQVCPAECEVQSRAHLRIRPWLRHQHCTGQSQAVQVSKSRDERLMVFNSHFHTKYRYVFQHVHNRNNTISKPKHMFWEHPGHGTGNMMGEFAFCVPEGTSHSLWIGKKTTTKKTLLT